MVTEKRRKFSRKLKSLFRTEEWQLTQHALNESVNDTSRGTTLAALNSGISPDLEIITQLNNDPTTTRYDLTPSLTIEAKPDLRDQVLTPNSPFLQSPVSPIITYTIGEGSDSMLKEDRERTHMRYQAAAMRLKEALELRPELWGILDVGFDDIVENNVTSKLRVVIENRLAKVSNSSPIWKNGRKLFEQIFVVFFPLTRNILMVAKEAQSVPLLNPCGLICGGLLLLLTIANREFTRRDEIATNLQYISRELSRVKLSEKLAKRSDCVGLGYRAMDVRSAVLNYFAVHIRRESKTFGIIGNIATTLVKGDMDCEAATRDLQAAVTEFNSALILLNASMAFQTVRMLGQLGHKVDDISKRVTELDHAPSDIIQSATSVYDKFIVPYEKNEHFTGRQSLLSKLCEKLCIALPKRYNHRVALHGLGGVGKTQIALEYVYTHKALHDRIYWISGVDKATLLSGYEQIGRRAGCINNHGDLSPSDMAKSVLSWLNKEEDWLLVVDNVDDSTVIDGYLPERSPRQLTLLTTRNPNTDEFAAQSFEVDVLEKNDAIDLLSIRSGAQVDDNQQIKPEAEEIVREVGCLPLAIEQAAAYIREVSKDIFKFLPSYRNNRKRHHSRTPKGNWKYGESIASTWRLSFKQVEQNNKCASRLLQLLAFLNPDGIYTDFLEAGKDALETVLQTVVGDPDIFYEALFELERFSLVRRQLCASGQRITIHRLVQLVIIDAMDRSDWQSMMAQVIRLGISAFPDPTLLSSNPNSLELSRRYRSQVMACLRHRELETDANVWNTLSVRVAGFLYFDGYYDDCASLASLTVAASKISPGPDHPETLQSMHNLASTFRKLARADEARKLFQETLATRTRVLGPEHLETLQSMHGLGWAFADLAQPGDAAKLHKESLTIKRKVLGHDHPETVLSMDGLAWAYWRLGEYHEASALHEETLEIFKRIHGLGHVDTLASMNGLGWAKWRLGRYEEAAQLFQDSLDIRKDFQRDDHPDTLSSLDGLAWSFWRLGQYQKATSVFQDTLELNRHILGPEHPDTAMNLYGLAWGHWRLARYRKAAELFQEAHGITTRILGPHHPDTLLNSDGLAWCHWSFGDYGKSLQLHQETLDYYRSHNHSDTIFSLYGLAWTQWSLGNYEEAESLFQERLAICATTLYPDHRDALMSTHGLASVYEKLGRYDEAVALFSETLNKRKDALAPQHPEILESMDGLASAYRGIGRYEDSIQLFQETLSLRKGIFGEEHTDTLQTFYGLAMSFHESGRCVEAEELFIKSWRGRESILGRNHPDTLSCMSSLAHCYQVSGRQGEADELFEMIAAKQNHGHSDSIHTQGGLVKLSEGFSQIDVGV